MYIDDFEDFYRADESEFPEEFDSRDNLEEDDTFEEFEELDDFRNANILRDFDDTDEINEFDEMNDLDNIKFTRQGICPFYRQFPFFPPTSGPDGPSGPGGPGRPGRPGRPDGPGQGNRPPSGPPPSIAPQQQLSAGGPQLYAVDPGSIRGCRFRFVYIWPRRGRGFWMWLTFVGRRSIAGWRWNGFTWYYFGMDLRRIESFRCY